MLFHILNQTAVVVLLRLISRYQYHGIAAFLLMALLSSTVYAKNLNSVLAADHIGTSASISAQKKIEALDDEKQQAVAEYRQLLRETRLATKYQQQLTSQVDQLEKALDELETNRLALRETRLKLMPLMDNMRDTLEQLVAMDVPFLKEERQARLIALKKTLADPALDEGEKMSRLLDAYQVELSYGYSVESWQGMLANDQLVQFLRVGRLGYYYLTPDQQQVAVWNTEKGWQPLESSWIDPVAKAIAVAGGTVTPELMMLPRPASAEQEAVK